MIDPELLASLVRRRRVRNPLTDLSGRREALALMAQGRTNAALAEELLVSTKTIEGHVRSIFTKFDLAPGEAEGVIRGVFVGGLGGEQVGCLSRIVCWNG